MASWWLRYRTSLVAAIVVTTVGVWPMLIAPLGRAYVAFCARYLTDAPYGHHYPPLAFAFLAPIIASILVGIAVILLREVRCQRDLAVAAAQGRYEADDRLRRIVGELGLTRRLRCTGDAEVYAFCGGFLRPRIYLSRGLIELLLDDELEAVLRHEEHHLRQRDPLRYFAIDLLGRLAPLFPALTTLTTRVRINAEVEADLAALNGASLDALAFALSKVIRATTHIEFPGAVAALSPTDARVAALVGQPITVPFDVRDVAVSLGLTFCLIAVLVWLSLQPFPLPPTCSAC